MTYIKEPAFWLAVVAVALVVNFLWSKFAGKGKLI